MNFIDRLHSIWHSPERIIELEGIIMAAAADYAARLDAVTNDIAAELAELRDQVVGDNDAWAAALDGPISRLESLGKSTEDPTAPADGTVPTDGNPVSDETPEASGDSSF